MHSCQKQTTASANLDSFAGIACATPNLLAAKLPVAFVQVCCRRRKQSFNFLRHQRAHESISAMAHVRNACHSLYPSRLSIMPIRPAFQPSYHIPPLSLHTRLSLAVLQFATSSATGLRPRRCTDDPHASFTRVLASQQPSLPLL